MPDAVDHDGNVKDDVAAGGRPSSPKRTGRPASAYRARPPGRPGLARSHALHSPATGHPLLAEVACRRCAGRVKIPVSGHNGQMTARRARPRFTVRIEVPREDPRAWGTARHGEPRAWGTARMGNRGQDLRAAQADPAVTGNGWFRRCGAATASGSASGGDERSDRLDGLIGAVVQHAMYAELASGVDVAGYVVEEN